MAELPRANRDQRSPERLYGLRRLWPMARPRDAQDRPRENQGDRGRDRRHAGGTRADRESDGDLCDALRSAIGGGRVGGAVRGVLKWLRSGLLASATSGAALWSI